jgi:tetratricopeptide (TPR) repeat protein
MLETIREYALERLAEHGELETLRRRHANYYLQLAEHGELALQGPDQQRWLDRLEADHDNLRAALAWSQAVGEAESGLRIAGALWWFWWAHSHASEGRRWLNAVLSQSGSRTAFRAKALYATGILALLFDSGAAPPPLQEALSIYQELGDRNRCAAALLGLGWQLTFGGDYSAGGELVEQSVALYRAEPVIDRWGLGFALIIVELLAMQRGDYAAARTYGEEALVLFRELGQPYGISQALNYLGDVARLQGDYAAAATWYEESVALLRRSTIKGGIPAVLHNMGYVLLAQGQIQRAAAFFVESLTLQQENGDQHGIAECLAGLAAVAAVRQQPECAARLFAAAKALHAVTDGPIWPAEQAEYERHRAAACVQLDAAAWEAAWAAGHAMPLDQAIVEAKTIVGTRVRA